MQSGPKNTAKILTLDRCGDRAGGPSFLLRTLHEISGFHFLEPQLSFSASSRVRAVHQAETNFD
jgi:hypothetical protein